jgi:DNA-binding NarL/FixJ family response regulator
MSALRRLLLDYGLLPQQFLRLDAELFALLEKVAAAQQRSVHDVAVDALYTAVYAAHAQVGNDRRWHELTPRQQQVAALVCLGYTNEAIARQLVISVNTVRSHVRHVLDKYAVASKAELRIILSAWDFETWYGENDLATD